jgi:hypothetical protein
VFTFFAARGYVMETAHTETVVDKAVTFVKDMFGIPTDTPPNVEADPEYSDAAPAITSENAMRFDPNAFETKVGRLNADTYVRPLGETDAERLRREVGEDIREKSGLGGAPLDHEDTMLMRAVERE